MTSRCLQRLFRPRTIAVFGGREAERVVSQCDRIGFLGEVWPLHPSRDRIGGRRCFRTVGDLPAAPDAAFLGVNRNQTIEITRALAQRGSGGAICYASGFREAENGASLEDDLLAAAGSMPVIGPNCYGLLNYLDRVAIWPDQHGGTIVESGVAIVTQSSNIALNMTMQRRGLPVAYVATMGNQAQLGIPDVALGLIEDDRVTAIGVHVEGVVDAARFEALAVRARELRTPVVALTVGRSDQSRRAAISHTASVAGSEAATAAFFSRLGIPRLRFIPEFLEALKLLHVHGALTGRDLCSMSCSGGEAALMADAAAGRAVRFRPLGPEERARVMATLGDRVAVENPLDYHTFAWGCEEAMAEAFSTMIGCGYDLSLLVLDFPRSDRCDDGDWDTTLRAIRTASERTGGRVAVVATLPECMPEPRAADLIASGIVPLCGIDEALAAADAAAAVGESWEADAPAPLLRPSASDAEPLLLLESDAKAALATFGLPVPQSRVVGAACAAEAATAIGFPVAVKVMGFAHKSEAGAVRLNLASAPEVEIAAKCLTSLGDTLLVERMVTDAVAELLIGVTRQPRLGLLMTIAAGGTLVELLGDAVSMLLPVSDRAIRDAILGLKTAPLLDGYRGRPVADVDAAVAAASAIARFAEAHAERLEELDVNPLLVRANGKGAVAVDALIRMRPA